jgi:hypothetical protein
MKFEVVIKSGIKKLTWRWCGCELMTGRVGSDVAWSRRLELAETTQTSLKIEEQNIAHIICQLQ